MIITFFIYSPLASKFCWKISCEPNYVAELHWNNSGIGEFRDLGIE